MLTNSRGFARHNAAISSRAGRPIALTLLLTILAAALSGCLYPQERLAQNQLPPKEAVRNVQDAVDQFQADQGLLPILNSGQGTPKYEKFRVDFAKLQRMNYIGQIPAAAFENGGSYYFLILNEETDPTVKLMSLAVYQQLSDVQTRVNDYRNNHNGDLPAAGEAYQAFLHIDFELLGGDQPDIRSVFSGSTLNVIMDESGAVYGDYGIDIRQTVEQSGEEPDPAADLRELLVERSDYVPVKSPSYVWVDGDPTARLPVE